MENEAQEIIIDSIENNEGGEGNEIESETISISKSDYEKMNQTLGSLKRELKDFKKSNNEPKETSTTNQPEGNKLLERLEKVALRQAGIDNAEDIDLARKTAKKWNMDIEEVLMDEDFKVKLEKQQTSRANTIATTGIKGSANQAMQAKNTPEYWVAKGVPPTPIDVPDRKTRAKITRAMITSSKSSKTFYND
jgi:hypothetical protein